MAVKKSFVAPKVTNRNWTLVAGLVQIPVGFSKMYADGTSQRWPAKTLCAEHEVVPKSQPPICPNGNHVVTDKVKGYEYEPGKYAILSELEAALLPKEHDGIIEIKACVDLHELDDTLYEGAYIAAPSSDASLRPYATLCAYLRDHNKAMVGVGTWYGSVRAFVVEATTPTMLVVHLCNYYANLNTDLITTASEIQMPEVVELDRKLAEAAFSTMSTEMDWASVKDTIAESQRALIQEKIDKGTITAPTNGAATVEEVPDILDALRQMVEEAEAVPA